MERRTDEEIDELKRQWEGDPIWELETTPGFEAHYEELLAYSSIKQASWRHKMSVEQAHWRKQAEQMSHFDLMVQIVKLNERIEELEKRFDVLGI